MSRFKAGDAMWVRAEFMWDAADNDEYSMIKVGNSGWRLRVPSADLIPAAELPGFREGIEAAAKAVKQRAMVYAPHWSVAADKHAVLSNTADAIRTLDPPATSREQRLEEARKRVCDSIVEIMQTYDEQEAQGIYGGTPGGLEHMGDVWRLLDRWRTALVAADAAEQSQPCT